MKQTQQLIVLISLLIASCSPNKQQDSIEKWKQEIVETEQAFSEMAEKEGIPKAFLTYAAEDVVILRNEILIIGKEALRESYKKEKPSSAKTSLTWKPDFVDVSISGDLGYTYGKYVYTSTDTLGQAKVFEGVFHTVWKRQADGNWKFVWD